MAWHEVARPGLLLLLYAFMITDAMAKNLETIRYETVYACEGKTLKIECKEGELIKLIRANYGRFSITICNDHGNTDWSVNCMSPKSLRVLHNMCSHNQNCSIPASTNMFGDPCPGTHKYLEAHYQCLPAATTTTTNRPSPPWLITSQPPMWSTVKPTARPPPPPPRPSMTPPKPATTQSASTEAAASSPSPPNPVPATDVAEYSDGDRAPFDVIPGEITTLPYSTVTPKKMTVESVTDAHPPPPPPPSVVPTWAGDNDSNEYCSPTTFRGIDWNWTRVGATNIQSCPGGTTGFAKWNCTLKNSEPHWWPATPDLSGCRSVWLTSLEQRVQTGRDPLVSITNDLAQVTSSKTLYGGDMMITTKIVEKLAKKMSQDIQTFPDPRQREAIVTEMLHDVVKTSSNLLDASQHASWKDLSFTEQMNVATSLLIELEENAFLLADTVTREKTVDQTVKNIMLSVRVLETKNVESQKFPPDNKWTVSNDSIELPKGALLENSDGHLVRLVFVAFDRLEEVLQWHPDTTDNNRNVTRMLNSKVISASLGKGRHIQLREPVRLTFRHLQTENVSNPSCVFWDYTTSTWSEEGCHVDVNNSTHTVCLCDHLTNFAILMDVHSIYLPIGHQVALQVITYIGCIISITCLALAVLTFQLFRGLKSDRTTIHCNLCVCLLVAELLFLIGIWQTENKIACGIIAAVLQYFFLCAFVWMFFEGFQLYVMLIEVFEAEKSRIRWYYLIAYGLPLVIVAVTGSIFPHEYGTDRYCWLRADNYIIYSFVGPVIVVIVLNLIFLTMAIFMMCRHANTSVSMKNKEHSRLASTRAWLKGAVVLVFLLGLTWIFGFLYLNKESVVMAYLFAALNSLQGCFIFIFHCVQNEKVRKEYRKFIRKHSWLPKCLRCSKLSGGTGSSSGSSGAGKERRTSLYAGSNSNNPSGPNSHSTDNTVLSPHATSLQRDWSSRSCTNVNRMGNKTVPTTTTSATMAATLSRQTRASTAAPQSSDPQNTSTLPYFRNVHKNTQPNQNIPKSVSTWGPLHKPSHWKSCSRDSGHGGSEQEDSPRSHAVIMNNAKDIRRQPYFSGEYNNPGPGQHHQHLDFADYGGHALAHPKHLALPHGVRKKNGGGFLRAGSPSYHTYMEVHGEGRVPRGLLPEDDPVYEEIERNEIQVSDMSDEDGKRQSDMSRQSSRSYGDHRPLIPYSPATDRNVHSCLEMMATTKHHGKERYTPELVDQYRMMRPNIYRGGDATRSLAAVLDGETVVCHLEPPEMYPHDSYTTARTLVLPQYSES